MHLSFRILILTLALVGAVSASDVDDFQHSWISRALQHQRQLDRDVPLAQATFLATHNSYNSSRYTTAGSYWDPNQSRSIGEQLRIGIRAVEFDVHSYFSTAGWPWQWHWELLLCHGQDNHVGCSSFDRAFQSGLGELRDWLNRSENRDEVLLLYIEDHINGGDYGKAINALRNALGDKIYRPAAGGCRGMPMQISKADIIASGKRVLVMSDGCDDANWAAWVHGGVGDHLSGYPTGHISELGGYPYCEAHRFSRAFFNTHLVRYQEDRTNLSSAFGDPDAPVTPETLRTLLQCGVNLPGMDKLTPFDGRLEAAVWSWDNGEPNNAGGIEHCAEHRRNGRFNDVDCNRQYAFACRDPNSGAWHVSLSHGTWSQGEAICGGETSGVFHYATPRSSYDNEQLKALKQARGIDVVWLRYNNQNQTAVWIP